MRNPLPYAAAAALVLASLFAAPLTAAAATVGAGDLIKLQDDHDPKTDLDTAVYYVGNDGKRYVFPNARTYATWYADFSSVKTVSASELASLPIGGNVTYRPGTRLVKIVSDPKVYAVEPKGALRWIKDEAVAKALFGSDWNARVDDVSDAFFADYAVGAPLSSAVYPDGSIVKRASDGAVFRIEGGNKRRIASVAVLAALRVQDRFVLMATGDLSSYPDGTDINAADPGDIDASQKTAVVFPSVPTLSIRAPATNYIAIGGDSTLLEFHVATAKTVALRRVVVRIDATTNGDPGSSPTTVHTVDDDKGGLVYGDDVRANLTGIRIVSADGTEIFGRKDPSVDVALDQQQTFAFTGSYTVKGGTEAVFFVRAQASDQLPSGEGFMASLVFSGTDVADVTTGLSVPTLPAADLVGTPLLALMASLNVTTTASGIPGSKTYVRGTKDAILGGFNFQATTVAPNVITSVGVTCYIRDSGGGAPIPGVGAGGTPCNVAVPQVSLYSGSERIAGPLPIPLEGHVVFGGLHVAIPASGTALLRIVGDVSPTLYLVSAPYLIAFDITDAASDVTVFDDAGQRINASGTLPNNGSNPVSYATIVQHGTVAWTWNGGGGYALAGREVLLGTLTADVHDDSYALTALTFVQSNAVAKSLGNVRLEYPTGVGTDVASVAGSFTGNDAVFTNLPITLPRDAKTGIRLYGQIVPREAGAVSGETVNVTFDPMGALQFTSKTDGSTYSGQDIANGNFTLPTNTTSSFKVRYTQLYLGKYGNSPSGTQAREQSAPVLTFAIGTAPEGGARIKKMVFKLVPGDAGQTGAQNDALEGWANINGDFLDDDGVANLRQIVPNTTGTIYGEGPGAHIQFSIVSQSGAVYPAPASHETAKGDYGLLAYTFDDDNELTLGPGAQADFSFELDTTKFHQGSDWPLTVELEGVDQFLWTDVPSGAYTPLLGSDASGLPFSGQVTVTK